MELPVLFQAEQFAQAVLLGGLLGLVYDLLRAPRKLLPKLAGVLDALFLLALFFRCYSLRSMRGRDSSAVFLSGDSSWCGRIFSRVEPGYSAGSDRTSPVF